MIRFIALLVTFSQNFRWLQIFFGRVNWSVPLLGSNLYCRQVTVSISYLTLLAKNADLGVHTKVPLPTNFPPSGNTKFRALCKVANEVK